MVTRTTICIAKHDITSNEIPHTNILNLCNTNIIIKTF